MATMRERVLIFVSAAASLLIIGAAVALLVTANPPAPASRVQRVKARETYYATCSSAIEDQVRPAQTVQMPPPGAISDSQAKQIIENALRSETGTSNPGPYSYLELVNATFPDGTQQLAWGGVYLYNVRASSMIGDAVIVYADAFTGKVLMIVTGTSVGDPSMTCEFDPLLMAGDVQNRLLFGGAAVCAILLIVGGGIAALVIWQFRRGRSGGEESPAPD